MKKKTLCKLVLGKFIFTCLLFSPWIVNAAQPEGGWKRNVEVEGESLIITWQNEEFRPKLMVWMQDSGIPKPYTVPPGDSKLSIPRKGINSVPMQLLIVPENRKLKPTVINVSQKIMEIQFNPESIPENEVWFWGLTPPSPCPPPSGEATMSVSVRLIHKRNIYKYLHSSFVWSITLDDKDKHEIPFYFFHPLNNTLSSISIEGFDKANDISQSLCHAHHGGECVFTAETNKDVWGKSHQINFEKNISFNRYKCPSY